MRILVTGTGGLIGSYVARELLRADHEVIGVDIAPAKASTGRNLRVDLTDAGQVYQALAPVEAVVHMAAWANAGIVPDTRTYHDNTTGTFNLFQACADLGIRRIVSASSAQVYGFAAAPPLYAPVDEVHPLRPLNCYALSKTAGEQAAAYFIERKGLEILTFRIMGCRAPSAMGTNVERIAQNPGGDASLLWTRTDARDMAIACRLAIETETVEPGPYNVTGAVVLEESSRELVKRHFADKTEIRDNLTTSLSPLSCARAESVFGYRPRYLWSVSQQHPEED